MKNTKFIFLFAIVILVISNMQFVSFAGDLAKDTVWTKRTTEGSFYSLQFINNDAVIVAQASGSTVFYDAFNSNELRRLAGSNKALLFNNENSFLRVANDKKQIEIYDTKSLELIGELENDDKLVTNIVISEDENYAVGTIVFGLRVWDLKTKKILRTKIIETNDFLNNIDFRRLTFENGNLLAFSNKLYKDDTLQKEYSVKEIIKYSFETLDSVSSWGSKGVIFKVSPSGKYIAFGTNGVEIYNLETNELVSNIKVLNSLVLTEIEFSNDESYIVTSSTTTDDILAIWDIKTGNQLYEYKRASTQCFSLSKSNKNLIKESGSLLIMYKVTEQMTSVNDNNSQITLYPNPTNGQIEAKYEVQKPNIFQYEITNISGQTLIRNNLGFKNVGENIETIDVNNLPLGQYNLRLYSENEVINFKFIRGE